MLFSSCGKLNWEQQWSQFTAMQSSMLVQGRVDSIASVFHTAAEDLGRGEVDAQVVKVVWDTLLPGKKLISARCTL